MSYCATQGFGSSVPITPYGVPGSPETPCPTGTHQTCLLAAPGKPTTPDMCSCRANATTPIVASVATTTKYNWGLIIGVSVAAIIVVKVATG